VDTGWLRDMPYRWLVQQAQLNIEALSARGGGYVGLASVAARFAQVHQPKRRKTGSPCRACGQPWPCPGFAVAWAVD
jgi:hypothetical protein